MNPPVDDMRVLGQLLRCPEGEKAQAVGDYLFSSNSQMIYTTIDCLPLKAGMRVLEIGFGNGKHLPYLLEKAPQLQYVGGEISAAMVAEATAYNHQWVQEGRATFCQVTAEALPITEQPFQLCFSVNTIYFIDDLARYCATIYQRLAQKGLVALTFIDKAVGEKAPFAKEGFQFYTPEQIVNILTKAGFAAISQKPFQEVLTTKNGKEITRDYWLVTGEK